jgi:hypothetical protein
VEPDDVNDTNNVLNEARHHAPAHRQRTHVIAPTSPS